MLAESMVKRRVKKAISARIKDLRDWQLNLSLPEALSMRRTMHETGGFGGPWFEQYAQKKGLFAKLNIIKGEL